MITRTIAVAPGDGIGPEIMDACIRIFQAQNVPLKYEHVQMGKSLFDAGHSTGMTQEAMAAIEKLGILYKGPMETPKGKGVKSINVTARKVWNTYANKRVFRSLSGVDTVFSRAGIPIDITIVRENIEDTYGGIEHMLTHDVALCRRFITRPGSLQVHRYAFEMASRKGARRITCGHKANIMKITDGLFLECFYEVAKDYPHLKADDVIVDDLAMKLVVKPHEFDVVVLPNLQGDIISDLCAGLVGGLGFAPSANIGDHISIFEAVHGTAPDIAGKGIANPTALLLSGIMMLEHLGFMRDAWTIREALLVTLKEGAHTADFGSKDSPALNTRQFTDAIIQNLGKTIEPGATCPVSDFVLESNVNRPASNKLMVTPSRESRIMGADLFVESADDPIKLGNVITTLLPDQLRLSTMSNRGTQVFPTGSVFTECINQYRIRLEVVGDGEIAESYIFKLADQINARARVCSVEMLMAYDGQRAYSLAQGQ